MKKFSSSFMGIVSIFLIVSFSGCTKDLVIEQIVPEQEKILIKGAFNQGFFDWDRIDEIIYYNNINREYRIPLPWTAGSAHNAGIPKDWIDINSGSANYKDRYYSRDNGWVLVYSNIHLRSENSKYFSLYNTRTGILRTFLYSPASSAGVGSSAASLALCLDKPSSLFNFTDDFAKGINDKKNYAGYTYSPLWTFGNTSNSVGYRDNIWYGIEIECAYDPNLQQGTTLSLGLGAITTSTTIGTGQTTGTIEGTIKSTSSQMPSLSLNINGSNNSSTSIVTNDIMNTIESKGSEIDEGRNKGNAFYTGLTKGLGEKLGTSLAAGVKDGLKSLLQGGGYAAIAKGLGTTVNSLTGGNESVSKVELKLNSNTNFQLETITQHIGWGVARNIPIPGTTTNDPPLYNVALGVWNLNKTPEILIRMDLTEKYNDYNILLQSTYSFYFELAKVELVLNPALSSLYTVKNFKTDIALNETNRNNIIGGLAYAKPFAALAGNQYYNYYMPFTTNTLKHPTYASEDFLWREATSIKCLVRVSFDLEDKQSKKIISFSRYFESKYIKNGFNISREKYTPW